MLETFMEYLVWCVFHVYAECDWVHNQPTTTILSFSAPWIQSGPQSPRTPTSYAARLCSACWSGALCTTSTENKGDRWNLWKISWGRGISRYDLWKSEYSSVSVSNSPLSSPLDGGRGEAESSDGHEVDSHQRNALKKRAALSDSPLHRSMCDSRWRRCSI